MHPPVGFVLLTHSHPPQSLRLVRRLNEEYADPPIVCHHDFSQCPLRIEDFPTNVSFVVPHVPTQWGTASVVDATLEAIRRLYAQPGAPEWFILISGSDYPICPARRVLDDLQAGGCDAYIRHKLVAPDNCATEWDRRCVKWYFAKRIWLPLCTRRLQPAWKQVALRHRWLMRRFGPYDESFRCYYGSHWFSANRRSAEAILAFADRDRNLRRHCRHVRFPEEMYFNTVLANAAGLKVRDDNFRYIDWSCGGSHPRTLGEADLSDMVRSGCHFARKLPWDERLLNQLDRMVARTAVGTKPSIETPRRSLLHHTLTPADFAPRRAGLLTRSTGPVPPVG